MSVWNVFFSSRNTSWSSHLLTRQTKMTKNICLLCVWLVTVLLKFKKALQIEDFGPPHSSCCTQQVYQYQYQMSPKISAIPFDYYYCLQDLEITIPFYITDLPQSPSSEKDPPSNTDGPCWWCWQSWGQDTAQVTDICTFTDQASSLWELADARIS